jgi:hypothetical protein
VLVPERAVDGRHDALLKVLLAAPATDMGMTTVSGGGSFGYNSQPKTIILRLARNGATTRVAPTGDLIGKIHLPETCSNLCFGGKKRNRLFMTASTSIYATYVETQGGLKP